MQVSKEIANIHIHHPLLMEGQNQELNIKLALFKIAKQVEQDDKYIGIFL